MKKTIFLLIFITTLLQNYAQQFAPVGSIWHYTQRTINPDVTSFKTIESVADTIINGKVCRKLIEVERYFDTIGINFHHMYSENDSVFFLSDNNFHLLYDFGANSGDTIILDNYITYNGSALKMIIDSVGTINIGNEQRKIQYIICGDGISIEFGDHVIEGVGNTSFMFPTLDGSVNGPLRCYQDDNTSLFFNPFHPDYGWNYEDCEEIIAVLIENSVWSDLLVYPNPAGDYIVFEVQSLMFEVENSEIQIVDVFGREVLRKPVISEKTVFDLRGIWGGVYFYQLEIDGKMYSGKFIVKE